MNTLTTKFFSILTKIFLVAFIGCLVTCGILYTRFYARCGEYIVNAKNASTIETAKEELGKAISSAEEFGLTEGNTSIFITLHTNDIGFWYKNMKDTYQVLDSIPEGTTILEKTEILETMRESLDSHILGIEEYPYNAAFLWWGVLSFILCVLCFILEDKSFDKDWVFIDEVLETLYEIPGRIRDTAK